MIVLGQSFVGGAGVAYAMPVFPSAGLVTGVLLCVCDTAAAAILNLAMLPGQNPDSSTSIASVLGISGSASNVYVPVVARVEAGSRFYMYPATGTGTTFYLARIYFEPLYA